MLENKAASILIVDDDPAMVILLSRALADLGQIRFATGGDHALRLIAEEAPDIVLLDAEMPGKSGFEVCELVHAMPGLAELPVIFVTSHASVEFEESGFAVGAVDFIAKPVNPRTVQARVKTHLRLKVANELLKSLAATDALTQMNNRRAFDEALRVEWGRAVRSRQPLALLMVDVDHFKRFNDHYGHAAGDDCLRQVGEVLRSSLLRPADQAARYGGEEFAMLLPNTDLAGGQRVADKVLAAMEDAKLPHADSPVATHVTVSIGVSALDENSQAWRKDVSEPRFLVLDEVVPRDLVHAADLALYAAKRAGRGRQAQQPLN